MSNDVGEAGLLHGIDAIADYLGVKYRQAHGMIERAGLPTFELAGRVCSRRSTVDEWLIEREKTPRPPGATKPRAGRRKRD